MGVAPLPTDCTPFESDASRKKAEVLFRKHGYKLGADRTMWQSCGMEDFAADCNGPKSNSVMDWNKRVFRGNGQ
jgi:hypothetical protein